MVTTNHHKSSSTSRMRTTATTLFYIFILVLLLGDGFGKQNKKADKQTTSSQQEIVGINAIQKTTPTAKKTSTTASTVIGGSGVPPTASESVNSAQQQHQQQQTKREAVNIEQQQQTHIINQNIQQQRRYYHHFRYSQELNTPSPQLSGIDGFPWPPNLSTSKQPSSSSSTSTTGTTASASASTSAHDDAVDGVNEEVEETIVFGETLDEDMIEKFVHDNKDKDKDKDNNSNKQKKEKDLNDNNSKKKSNNVDKQQQQQTKKSMNDNNNNNNNNPVSIFPLDLHFKNSQMCIDSKDSFVITNLKSHPIQILSIQTSSQHFETDFIRSFTLKDNENHRVRVVFKPRYIGEYNTTVQVHSVDQDSGLTYVSSIKVFGTAKGSFYQLSPISDRVLIDTMFSRSIYIYNPHNETLYIKDIYTSGAPFYLSLPPGSSTTSSDTPLPPSTTPSVTSSIPSTSSQKLKQQQQQQHESPQNNIWEIEPFTRGQIINLSFRSSLTGMFNNELHIDTNFANFTVYLQIQSIGETVHLSPESLDFGFITGKSDFKSVSLFLYNPEQEDINILEIRPLHPDPRLKFFIHDDSTTFAKSPSEIAHFFYSSELEGVFRGIILIRINGYKDTHIPYRAVVAHGDLSYNPKDVLFPLIPFGSGDIDMDFLDETQDEPYPRLSPTTLKDVASRPIVSKTTPGLYTNRLVLRNNFNVPLVIYSVHVSDNLFVVKDAPLGVSVKPHETWKPILLEINPNYKYNDRQLLGPGGKHASLYVDTNISVFEIDLHAYNRLLSFSTNLLDFETQPLSTFQERSIDFGVISRNEVRRRTFKLKNSNPFNLFITCVGHIQPPTNTNRFNIKTDGVRGIFGQDVVIINKSGTGRDTASGPSSSSSSSTPSSNSLSSKTLTADISMQLLSVYNDRGQFVHSGADFFGADHSFGGVAPRTHCYIWVGRVDEEQLWTRGASSGHHDTVREHDTVVQVASDEWVAVNLTAGGRLWFGPHYARHTRHPWFVRQQHIQYCRQYHVDRYIRPACDMCDADKPAGAQGSHPFCQSGVYTR
ncbi:hypothetical protein DFA_03961 [Cavenderia fasciculata]|uniref:Cyclic nucleotide-binding domain-containing protein n=1 Tax=Cavenderia fasciculata TaxID=261658 RepID=F4Q0W6_CACFS|nr:uncharacterized protein DFA_03961 [Cavenderia fasciculata]EGG18467.1 hypothetical protein DFA_03961 [Cavenderia fasciculata]|eukprot:XP_004366371.1 hypothetical protein DFA_03961 [Cavenderia fasciculata]